MGFPGSAVKKVLKAWAIVIGVRAYSQRKIGQKAPVPLPPDSVPRRVLRGLGFRHNAVARGSLEGPPEVEPVGGLLAGEDVPPARAPGPAVTAGRHAGSSGRAVLDGVPEADGGSGPLPSGG